ncbi:MAG: DUF899 family protein [Chthonomonas sp.]|nr:DUF899 family protein [Chthonomonas sp.]
MTDFQQRLAVLFKEVTAKQEELTAALRNMGATRVPDYEFKRGDGTPVQLSELFGDKDELIWIHNMGQRCNYCMLWADGLNGFVDHIQRRCALVLGSPDEPAEMQAYANSRGWRFPLASVQGTEFNKDMGFFMDGEGDYPGFSTFQKNADGTIDRFSMSFFGPGDSYCAVWPMFALLPRGVNDWEPER